MRTSAKLGLTALMAAVLLASAISTASARNISVNNQNIRAVWRSLEFVSLVTIRCRVTLEGRLHARTIVKSRGTLIGGITRIDVDEANCTNGQGTALRETGHITYEGFTGTLPAIRTVILLLSRIAFQIRTEGCTGNYGNETDNISGNMAVSSNEISTITPITGRNNATRTSGSFFCPGSGAFSGASDPVTLLGSNTRIRITLI